MTFTRRTSEVWVGFSLRVLALVGLSLMAACTSTTPQGAAAGRGAAPDAAEVERRLQVRMELAGGYFERGQFDTAQEELRQALLLRPGLPDAINLRSLIYAAEGQHAKAEEGFRQALAANPSDADTTHNYGWYLCQRQRFSDAIVQFQKALALPTNRTPNRTWLARGVCEARGGQLAQAEESLMRAYEFDAGNPTVAVNLAEVLLRRGALERASYYVRRVNARDDQINASSLWLELRIERRRGNASAVEELSMQLRQRFPASAETAALNSGRFDE
ncbi:type IV pilus biogenesis/stability protein PilW [Roseateles sp. BYS180W]|uniref:Type IV pilus biogenesis/stability protein PilW n=1 Tax=Roseateles rivi TaxID=3299028 RepID=A0ABW7FVU7_9BURK